MRLKIRAVQVTAVTENGPFRARADFADGLNFIRAENNSGKTTVLMAIPYALGLEGMLGPGREMPLKPAAYRALRDEDGVERPVLESHVMAEIENGDGARMTIQRFVKHEQISRDLVRTWGGGLLTGDGQEAEQRDMYVRRGGAAFREAGFHRRLAEFVGWHLPEAARYDGTTAPLYMEVFFPLFFVEQTRGWSGILSVVPRHLQIRDPGRRSIEFLLDLDANVRARRRNELQAREQELAGEWRVEVEAFEARLAAVGARLERMPRRIAVEWPPPVAPVVRLPLGEQWRTLDEAIGRAHQELSELEGPIPTADNTASEAAAELTRAEERLAQLNALTASTASDARAQRVDLESVDRRIVALDEDRGRYADAIRLRDLGSLQPLAADDPRCPTCEQRLPDTLLGSELAGATMTLEDNLALIDDERKTFRTLRTDASKVLDAAIDRLRGLRQQATEARREVRTLKQTLVQPGNAPSEVVIARRVRLVDRIEQLQAVHIALAELVERLTPHAAELREVRAELAELGRGGLTDGDRNKLRRLSELLREQLFAYGFSSVDPGELRISPDSYLPERAGDDLTRTPSSTDTVRLVWAYLTGLMEVAGEQQGNHPGLLALDEPGQHEIRDESLTALFERLAQTRDAGQQALVATSKPLGELETMIAGLDAHVQAFGGRTLTRDT